MKTIYDEIRDARDSISELRNLCDTELGYEAIMRKRAKDTETADRLVSLQTRLYSKFNSILHGIHRIEKSIEIRDTGISAL